ncbi:MAG: sensor histidine kinase [Janthinobacterium lividum]
MKLLTATTRYYLLLTAGLFVLVSGVLYLQLGWALRHEADEQLANERVYVQRLVAREQRLPPTLFAYQLDRSRRPQPTGFSDALLLDSLEHEWVPFRQLTFKLAATQGGQPAEWLTLRKSLVESHDLLRVVLGVMAGALLLLMLGVVAMNYWLAERLWGPFRRTLTRLRGYDLQRHQPLDLPTPAIAEFAELNQALNQLSERLVADYESLRQFTENAAHETQTPLAIMQAKVEQLLQAPVLTEDESTMTLLGELHQATRRLSRLHQSLTLLTRLENHQFAPAQAVPLHLDQVVRDRLAMLEPLLEARGIHLQLHLDENLPARTMHPGLADSLLHNLLQNAIKHNQPGGILAVSLSGTALEVSNTGPAIEGDPMRFFERFRKHNAASDSPGLGLSIVQHICTYYGFRVRYEYVAGSSWHTLRVEFG